MADYIVVAAILALLALACIHETREAVMGHAAFRAGVNLEAVRGVLSVRSWAATRAIMAELALKGVYLLARIPAAPYLAVCGLSRLASHKPMIAERIVRASLRPFALPFLWLDTIVFNARVRADDALADLVEDARRAKDSAEWEGGY